MEITLKTIRDLANKYKLKWHSRGKSWVINGIQQHYSYKVNNAGEKAVLIDYMVNWGQSVMSNEDFGTVLNAKIQICF